MVDESAAAAAFSNDCAKAMQDGTLEGGVKVYDLSMGGVDIAPKIIPRNDDADSLKFFGQE